MSMALLVGSIVAYPINWWLVRYHLKHGMMTVRPTMAAMSGMDMPSAHSGHSSVPMKNMATEKPYPPIPIMTALSILALVVSVAITTLVVPM
jgi:hypothetical protein